MFVLRGVFVLLGVFVLMHEFVVAVHMHINLEGSLMVLGGLRYLKACNLKPLRILIACPCGLVALCMSLWSCGFATRQVLGVGQDLYSLYGIESC